MSLLQNRHMLATGAGMASGGRLQQGPVGEGVRGGVRRYREERISLQLTAQMMVSGIAGVALSAIRAVCDRVAGGENRLANHAFRARRRGARPITSFCGRLRQIMRPDAGFSGA